jgi:hypothetical protein
MGFEHLRYSEMITRWNVWSIGVEWHDGRGWDSDELLLYFGPFVLSFTGWRN